MMRAESLQAGVVCSKVDQFTQNLDAKSSFAKGMPWVNKLNASMLCLYGLLQPKWFDFQWP